MEKLIATNDRMRVRLLLRPQKLNVMKIFKTEDYKEYFDKMGISYSIDSNPSPERIEKIKKMLESRNARLAKLVEDYRSGKLQMPL